MLKKLLELGHMVALLPSISLFLGASFLGLYGVYILLETLYTVFTQPEMRDATILSTKLISVMDIHLLSVVLYIFAVGLYDLFIGKLNTPEWLEIKNIEDLKAKLVSVIILILAITFTKNVVKWQKPVDTLLFGASIAIVIFVLILYHREKEKHT